MTTTTTEYMQCPLGWLRLEASLEGLELIWFCDDDRDPARYAEECQRSDSERRSQVSSAGEQRQGRDSETVRHPGGEGEEGRGGEEEEGRGGGGEEGRGGVAGGEGGSEPSRILAETRSQLQAYFDKRLTAFDLPLRPRGTPFQLEVWRALCEIPYGRTTSYGDLARQLGRPRAIRAVGAANGRNPLPIVVPCHRVIGADGGLVGFGGGIDKKRWLLMHEGALLL